MTKPQLTATFLYCGMPDYWPGHGDRWDDNAGCLFAYYDHTTTLRQLIEEWCDDYCNGGDCDTFPDVFTQDDVRNALIGMLSPQGLADYESNAIAGCAADYRDANEIEDIEDDSCELPFAVVLLKIED